MKALLGLALLAVELAGSTAGAVTLTVLGTANPNLAGRAIGCACCIGGRTSA